MLNFNLSKKEALILFAEVFFSSVFFAFLCLIQLSLYLKLIFAFLIISFLWVWAFRSLKKTEKRYDLLSKERDMESKKYLKLTESAIQICQTSLSFKKGADFSPKIVLFFKEFFDADRFLFFAKKGNVYKIVVANNVRPPERRKLLFKQSGEFVSTLSSLSGLADLEFVNNIRMPQAFKSVQKESEFNSVIPLRTDLDLWGFVFLKIPPQAGLKSDETKVPLEQRLATMVFDQLALNLQKDELLERLNGIEKKLTMNLNRYRSDLETLNKDVKRKVFDLNAVLGIVNNLYSILEEERLFSSFAKMILDHLEAKSILVMLPEDKTEDIVVKFSYGTDSANITDLKIEKRNSLYSWIKNEKELWSLYDMQKLSEDEVLGRLLSAGFQIGAKLSFTHDRFGLVLLGSKSDGSKYRQIDLQILAILVGMLGITYKNIKHYKTIEELSYTDSMTGLYNYRYFYKRLTEEVFRAKRFGRKLALVIFDIDEFKIYNDTYGHQAGDQVLKQLGELLSSNVRSIDVISRYGGEEFCVIMPESDQDECFTFMERLRKTIMSHSFKDENRGHEHNITISLGGAIYPYDARTVDRIIYCADMALLKAKGLGRNKSVMYAEQTVALKEQV
jgi:diguanylate cyclase (GGDEF)-like protein